MGGAAGGSYDEGGAAIGIEGVLAPLANWLRLERFRRFAGSGEDERTSLLGSSESHAGSNSSASGVSATSSRGSWATAS